jgi:hypothetical protein
VSTVKSHEMLLVQDNHVVQAFATGTMVRHLSVFWFRRTRTRAGLECSPGGYMSGMFVGSDVRE